MYAPTNLELRPYSDKQYHYKKKEITEYFPQLQAHHELEDAPPISIKPHIFDSGVTITKISYERIQNKFIKTIIETWTTRNPSYITPTNASIAAGAALLFLQRYWYGNDIETIKKLFDKKSKELELKKTELKNGFHILKRSPTGKIETTEDYLKTSPIFKSLQRSYSSNLDKAQTKFLENMSHFVRNRLLLHYYLEKELQVNTIEEQNQKIAEYNHGNWTPEEQQKYNTWKEENLPTINEDLSVWETNKKDLEDAYLFEYRDTNNVKQPVSPDDIKNTLEPFQFIINSDGDGNCGYRAILASQYFNGLSNKNLYTNLEQLIDTNFEPLFKKYKDHHQFSITQLPLLKHHLINVINDMKQATSINDIQKIINENSDFDEAMIMFERYLTVDYMEKSITPDEKISLLANHTDEINQMQEHLNSKPLNEEEKFKYVLQDFLTWGQWAGDEALHFIAKAMGIHINSVTLENGATHNRVPTDKDPIGTANILYLGAHYQILVPKQQDQTATA